MKASARATRSERDRGAPALALHRTTALARAALRDDVYSLHRALTGEVLRGGLPDREPDELVGAWVERNPASERYLETLADIRVGRVFDLTTLPVAVSEMRNLLQAPVGRSNVTFS